MEHCGTQHLAIYLDVSRNLEAANAIASISIIVLCATMIGAIRFRWRHYHRQPRHRIRLVYSTVAVFTRLSFYL